jgi:hypothetical protein
MMLRHIIPRVRAARPLKNTLKRCLRFAAKKAPNHFGQFSRVVSSISDHTLTVEVGERVPWRRDNQASVASQLPALRNQNVLSLGLLRNPISHGALIKLMLDERSISIAQAYLWANQIYVDRNFDELNSFLDLEVADLHPVQAYLRERMNEYRGLSAIRAGDLLPIVETDKRYSFLLRPVLNLYVQQLCQVRRVEEAARIVASHDIKSFSRQTEIGLIKALLDSDRRIAAGEFLRRFLFGTDALKQLYFHEVVGRTGDQSLTQIPLSATWRELLDIFATNYSPVDSEDARDVSRYLIEPLRRIPNDDRDLMDIRSSQDKRDTLTGLIANSLRDKKSLSLIRLGDGESYCFDTSGFPSEIRQKCAEDNLVREVHWWGTHVSGKIRDAIRRDVLAAVHGADILGIPGVHRLIRDRGGFNRRLLQIRQKRGLAVVLPAILDQSNRLRVFTEERVHQVMFNAEYLSALSQHAHRTVVVSCWDRDSLSGLELRNPEFIVIPGATKVRDAGVRPLFETYTETIESIRGLSAPGVLCLVGGGLIGKIFIDAAKQEGAVALDVGSVMDYFAGRATRNIADMMI